LHGSRTCAGPSSSLYDTEPATTAPVPRSKLRLARAVGTPLRQAENQVSGVPACRRWFRQWWRAQQRKAVAGTSHLAGAGCSARVSVTLDGRAPRAEAVPTLQPRSRARQPPAWDSSAGQLEEPYTLFALGSDRTSSIVRKDRAWVPGLRSCTGRLQPRASIALNWIWDASVGQRERHAESTAYSGCREGIPSRIVNRNS
jgi:hypothetical protein